MTRQLWGLILLVLGVLVLLQVTGVYNFGLAFWPVVLVLLGIAIIWKSFEFGGFSWIGLGLGLWLGGIGLFNILYQAGATTLSGSDIASYGWPLLLIALGFSILVGSRRENGSFCFIGCTDSKNMSGRSRKGEHSSRMHHIGDLYQGQRPWVLDQDLDLYHGIGEVVLDLTTAEIRPGNHEIFIKAGIGEVSIKAPDGLNVEVDASMGIGEINLFGEERSGFGGISLKHSVEATDAEATVKIVAKLGIGEVNASYMPAVTGVAR